MENRSTFARIGLVLGIASVILPWQALSQTACTASPGSSPPLRILFLGSQVFKYHQFKANYQLFRPALIQAGMVPTYHDDFTRVINPDSLGRYDCLVIYSNFKGSRWTDPDLRTADLTEGQLGALYAFVEGGKGLVGVHSASGNWPDNSRYVSLLGATFSDHGARRFTPVFVKPSHPALRGVTPLNSLDETFNHKSLAVDLEILMERDDPDNHHVPWTWVRSQGKGRVYYTASGHDANQWGQAVFHGQLLQAIRWASGKECASTADFTGRAARTPLVSHPLLLFSGRAVTAGPWPWPGINQKGEPPWHFGMDGRLVNPTAQSSSEGVP